MLNAHNDSFACLAAVAVTQLQCLSVCEILLWHPCDSFLLSTWTHNS